MLVTYPQLAFAFNPVTIEVTEVEGIVTLTSSGVTLQREPVMINDIVKGVRFDLQSIAQSLFNTKEFNNIHEIDIELLRHLDFTVSSGSESENGSIDIIWGALNIGEIYNRSKKLTWFKNFPFTFPVFLEQARSFVVEIDDSSAIDWKIIQTGKYNQIPNIDAQKKAVFYLGDTQPIVYESEFIFKVNVKSTNVGQELKICNLGTSDGIGYAEFDWGDGSIEQKQVQQSSNQYIDDPANGGQMEVVYGDDFKHTYIQAGEYTVTIQTTKRVNGFRFAPLPIAANNEWYTPGQMNDYVTQIIKIKSNYIINGSRMFSGVRYGWFDSDFVLECPNVNNYDYMFEFFGVSDYSYLDPNLINYSLLFPQTFFSLIANKTATKATRMFNGSGFLKIQRCMLYFSNQLTSVLETWRGMPYVGNNWTQRTNANASPTNTTTFNPVTEEFVETNLFWDNPKIQKFNGSFWFINDYYGNYLDSGFVYFWMLYKDMFKYNTAINIDISYMFRQCNRTALENDFFGAGRENQEGSFGYRIQKMDGCFWGGFNIGNPSIDSNTHLPIPVEDRITEIAKIGSSMWLAKRNWSPTPTQPFGSLYPIAKVNENNPFFGTELNRLFPEANYPNLISAVCAFGFRDFKRGVNSGFQPLNNRKTSGWGLQIYNQANSFDGTDVLVSQISLQQFLLKFTHATTNSGTGGIDAFTGCFWDFDVEDTQQQKKASDYDSCKLVRPDIFVESTMIGWNWGVSI